MFRRARLRAATGAPAPAGAVERSPADLYDDSAASRPAPVPPEGTRGGHGFELRLLGTLILTLLLVGTFQYLLTGRETKERLLEDATSRARGDVVFVQQAFDSVEDNDARVREMNSRLAAISDREGISHVLLVDRYGVVVASSDPRAVGTYHGGPALREVVSSGQVDASLVEVNGERDFRYVVPVDLPTGRFALEVQQNASVIEDQLDRIRRSSLFLVVVGILAGVLMFFLFGGRSLAKMHRRALRLSSRDGLTNLENHRSFQEALARAVSVSARQGAAVSLALIDLDDFKLVNDRLGHRRGDEVLKKVAALLETGRMGDRAFRIGGDEYALIMPDTPADGGWVVCERLWQRVGKELGGATISVGIATWTEDMDAADLQEHADVALYEAKRRGRNGVVSFEELGGAAVFPAEKVRSVRRLLVEQNLGTAFQPIWDLQAERPLGYEALARPPKEYGLQGPYELFQIGEMIGRSQELDLLSWRCALERAKTLPDDVLLFLNVSPFTADHGDGPVNGLCELVQASGIPPHRVVVEFTEKWSGRRDLVIEQAERLRGFGFRLALDDVGAGSGDLEMMARLPVDFLKIDLNVVKKALTDSTARGVLFAVTAFAAHSGSFVIAEGIEDASVLGFIRGTESSMATPIAVRGGQGYYLGMPAEGSPDYDSASFPGARTDSSPAPDPTSMFPAAQGGR